MVTKHPKRGLSRRAVLKLGAAASLLPAFAVRARAASGPIQVGFLTVNTGPLAAGGKQQEEGVALFVKQRNGTIAGRKLTVITEDTAGNPAQAKVKTQELVERDKVPVMIGPLATNEALAIDDYVRNAKVPLITTTSSATVDLRVRKVNPWVLHAGGTAPQVTYALGDYAARTLHYKTAAIIAEDFTYGYEGAGGFQLAFEEAGGRVVQKQWPPLNAPDYAPYLAQLSRSVDCLYMGFAGINPLRFLTQYKEYGLKGKIPVLGNTTSTDEGILRRMGDEALGVVTAGWYAATLKSADNEKFVAAIRADYGHVPGFYTAGAYEAMLIVANAIERVKGDVENAPAFLKALHDVHLTRGLFGKFRLDAYGTPILDIHIRKVERRDGQLENAILKTYPQVSQFWNYDPQKFMAQPNFSRSFPPLKS